MPSLTIQHVCEFLERFAPPALAEEWDNVGLLVGDPAREVPRIMTCLTVTADSADEAIAEGAGLIVTHHPLPFRPLKQLTTSTETGRLLLRLIERGIAIHSPHTAFDSAARGINQQWAEGLGLQEIRPLREALTVAGLGSGRYGRLDIPLSLAELIGRVKSFLNVGGMHVVGDLQRRVTKVAIACGSAGSFLPAAREAGCEVLVTGETSFHTCLEGLASDVSLVLPGHFASERFGVEKLAEILGNEFPAAHVWASRRECDPLSWH